MVEDSHKHVFNITNVTIMLSYLYEVGNRSIIMD